MAGVRAPVLGVLLSTGLALLPAAAAADQASSVVLPGAHGSSYTCEARPIDATQGTLRCTQAQSGYPFTCAYQQQVLAGQPKWIVACHQVDDDGEPLIWAITPPA